MDRAHGLGPITGEALTTKPIPISTPPNKKSMELSTQLKSTEIRSTSEENRQYVSFWLDEELFGVNILDVKEVSTITEITPVFHAPKEVRGYLNLRGEIHLVLDLRYLLGLPEHAQETTESIIIFKQSVGQPFGIIVDRVDEVLEFTENEINFGQQSGQPTQSTQLKGNLVEGICKLQDKLITLLDSHQFLAK